MKKLIRSWILFDWASQPFHTVIVTFVFAPYFVNTIIGDEVRGQALVANMAIISGLAVAICAPLATAISDYAGGRKKWIFFLSLFFVLACFGLYFEFSVGWIMASYVLAYFFVEMLLVFTNAYLPEITTKDNVGKVSNIGWGLGYMGGLIVLFLYLFFLMPVPDTDKTVIQLTPLLGANFGATTGPVSAVWYLVFMIPFFMFMPETKPKGAVKNALSNALRSLKSSLIIAWKDKKLFWFFFMSLISRDALAGVFVFGSLYASNVLKWPLFFIAIYGIVLNITGVFGGLIGSWLVGKRNTSFVVMVSLWLFTIVSFMVLSTNLTHVIFIPVALGSQLPHITFFICGMLIGAGAGSLQGSLRGLVGPLTEGKIAAGEAFGLYGMLGRATAFVTPFAILIVTGLTQSAQLGVWPVFVLFVIALLVYYRFAAVTRDDA